jgi:F0F1-type ATP synthase beta subunit
MLAVEDLLLPAERGKCVVISRGAGLLKVVVLQSLSVETTTLRENF